MRLYQDKYRAVEQQTTADWSCAPRWKTVVFTLTEGQIACANIAFRAENPGGSKMWLRLKECVRRAKLDPALWSQYVSSRCGGLAARPGTCTTSTRSRRSRSSSPTTAQGLLADA